jgi:hypothetical protein
VDNIDIFGNIHLWGRLQVSLKGELHH